MKQPCLKKGDLYTPVHRMARGIDLIRSLTDIASVGHEQIQKRYCFFHRIAFLSIILWAGGTSSPFCQGRHHAREEGAGLPCGQQILFLFPLLVAEG
jgi:hypothetical protein